MHWNTNSVPAPLIVQFRQIFYTTDNHLKSSALSFTVCIKGFRYVPNLFQGILDYVDNLTVSQMRSLFSMISKLTTSVNHEESNDDMVIVIQKQLSATILKQKRIGIIGAMMLLANMSRKRGTSSVENDCSQSSGNTTLPEEIYRQVFFSLSTFCVVIYIIVQ